MHSPRCTRSILFVMLLSCLSGALANNLRFGAYVYSGVWSGMEPVYTAEVALGRRLDIVQWFMNWDNAWDSALVNSVTEGGRVPLITWEAHGRPLQNIIDGHYDAYLHSWAQGVAAYSGTVYLRIFPEMNGDWTPWSGDPERLNAAWRHVVEIFRQEGAHNVHWVWSPNETDEPRTPENRMEAYYPGSGYVDVLAIDGYNWGDTRAWSQWRSFEEIFAEPYRRISALGSQPIWVAEVGSTESGGNKEAWIRDMFSSRAFERLEAIIWFDEEKEADWHFRSSAASLQAFRDALANSILLTGN